ncbi:hypothetical protein [Poseidonocella sedimentorum]|uniref:Uncharacterized protein n=1 Tax=Poseidonocella sedimentorum TaxID=871652 RepID=A0A1I6EMH5_9RHOB|nr:hypothetical protein [Poseidonocella sedimentorum]SFR18993.1 hypothetical protein SAMN04515673_11536 [Poseidonocella sedimentorum]
MGYERGAVPVGSLKALPQGEARLIRTLRMWCAGPDHQAEVWAEMCERLGGVRARQGLKQFEALVGLMIEHGRRPMMRHGVACDCVGADEAIFAHFVAAAASGDRDEAVLLASLLVRADLALHAVSSAELVGLMVMGEGGRTEAPDCAAPQAPHGATLH